MVDHSPKVLDFEQKYVHDVYNRLAISTTYQNQLTATNDSPPTRPGKCSRKITEFIKSFPDSALIGDIGKYISYFIHTYIII